MRALDDMSNEQLADELAELDLAIETDQGLVASAQRRIRNNSRQREHILNILSYETSRKGWH
jgi:hypothetical protein